LTSLARSGSFIPRDDASQRHPTPVSIQGTLSRLYKRGCVAFEIYERGDASTGSTVDEAGDDSSPPFQQTTHGSIGHGHYDSDGVGLENTF
jgi:hypothetical protein